MHGAVNAVLVSRAKLPSLSSGLAEREGITSDWWRAASSARNRFDSFVVPTTCSAMDQRAVLLGPRPPYPTRQRQADGLVAAVRAGSGLGLARRPVRLVLEKPHSIRSTPSRRPGAPAARRMACRRDAVTFLYGNGASFPAAILHCKLHGDPLARRRQPTRPGSQANDAGGQRLRREPMPWISPTPQEGMGRLTRSRTLACCTPAVPSCYC
jgi:hypothetical protein